MNVDEICAELENADGLPTEALAAAVLQAAKLGPSVIAVIRKAAEGVFLIPTQENLLFFGLHALAAARETNAYGPFLDLLRCQETTLERLLGDSFVEIAAQLLISLYDDNVDPLYELLENTYTDGGVKWTVFMALARLIWEGRALRDRLVTFLDRFDREALAPLGDCAWEGWQDAVLYLGLTDFEDRVRAGWATGRISFQNDLDQREYLERLDFAAVHPDDPRLFLEDGVIPIDDPVRHLALTERDRRKEDDTRGESADPAEGIALNASELDWLGGFLVCDQAPDEALNLEQVDGFFAALVAGPETVPPSEYFETLWGSEDGGPVYDSLEQAEYVIGLLMRHWNTIALRLSEEFPHPPILFSLPAEERGCLWAEGFMLGLELRQDAWTPLARDHNVGELLVAVFSLADGDLLIKTPDRDTRQEILHLLPTMLLAIHRFWRELARNAPSPVRSSKIGRNDSCPCGSGRKYKKCCGTKAPPRAH